MGNYSITGSVLWRGTPDSAASWLDTTVYVHDGIVSLAPKPGVSYTPYTGYALPGLCDVHCHIGLASQGETPRDVTLAGARADAATGALLIRDCGVPGDTTWVQEDPTLPKLIRCGTHIARPKRYLRYYGVELEDPNTLPEEAARQAQRSNGWIKIVADWIDRSEGADSDLRPLWETPALVDAVAAAHEHGARVTVHAFSHAAIAGLLEAGVDCIEHATGLDPDQIQEVARRGIAVTPTILQVDRFIEFAEAAGTKYPRYGATMRAMYETRREHMAALRDAGIKLLPGTDTGGYQKHGSLPAELAKWPEIGCTNQEVLDAATWQCRDYLGYPTLQEGAPADLVVYGQDPRQDLGALASPEAIILRGENLL